MTKPRKGTIAVLYNTSLYVLKLRRNLIQRLRDDGWEVVILAPHDASTRHLQDAGLRVIDVPMSQYGMNPLAELRTVLSLRRKLRDVGADVALCFTVKPNIFGGIAARLAGIPVINNVAGAGRALTPEGSRLLRGLVKRLYRLSFAGSAHVFFQNNEDMAAFVGAALVDPAKASRLPGSGVDLAQFTVAPLPPRVRFLFVGRLLLQKGIGDYIAAARALRRAGLPCEMHVVGEHEEHPDCVDRKTLDTAIAEGAIVWHGAVLPQAMPDLMAAASCVVLPSGYGEGVPRSLLEACASGRPIITTDHPGCRDTVQDGVNGLLVPVHDAKALQAAMAAIARMSPAARARMGSAGRELAARVFDERIVIDRYRAEIDRILHPDAKAIRQPDTVRLGQLGGH